MKNIAQETELISKVIAGQNRAFEVIVNNYSSSLYKLGLLYLYQKDEIEDAIQSSFLHAFEKLRSFRGESSFKSWISKIMINECRQVNRKLLLKRKAQDWLREPMEQEFRAIDSEIIRSETKIQLEKAISQLPPIYKSVFTHRLILGTSTHDTALSLGITEDTVKIRLMRAKRKIRKYLLKSESTFEEFLAIKN